MNRNKVSLLLQYALIVASEEDEYFDRQLGSIHLIKYVYLADLLYARRKLGASFTETEWSFHHFGPWSVEVFKQIEPALLAIGATKKTFNSNYDSDSVRWVLEARSYKVDEIEKQIDFIPRQAIKKFVHMYKNDTKSLLHFVYNTKPMLVAAPGEILNLATDAQEETTEKTKHEANIIKPLSKKKEMQIKQNIQTRLAEEKIRRMMQVASPPPRYDEIFFKGQDWLDSLGGESIQQSSGEVILSEDIWKSKTRSDTDAS